MRIIGVKRCLAVCLVCVLTVIAVGCNNKPELFTDIRNCV